MATQQEKVDLQGTKDRKSEFLKWLFIVTVVSAVIGFVIPVAKSLLYKDLFSDFAEVLVYCLEKNPYDGSGGTMAIYPPISYLIFYPFLIFCHHDVRDLLAGNIDLSGIHTRPMFVVAYMVYFVIMLALILLVIAKMTKIKGKNLFYLLGAVIVSGPVWFVFFRANVILVPLLMTLIFFWLYQSEKRWPREVALVCLALAIAIKIYPVILVLVLFKDRRWLDIVKTGVYAAAFVFVPFVFVSGNLIDNIKLIFNNYSNQITVGVSSTSVSLVGVANAIVRFLQVHWHVNIGQALPIIARILKYVLVAVAVVTLFLCHKSTQKMAVATVAIGCYILFQNVSYAYVLLFTLVLLVMFLDAIQTYSKRDFIFYLVIFMIIFFATPYLYKFCLLQFCAIVVLVVKAIVDLWVEYRHALKEQPQNALNQNQDSKGQVLKWLFIVTLVAAVIGYTALAIQMLHFNYNGFHAFASDFAEVLSYCLVKNPYNGSSGITSIYPPISYLIFFPFLIFCRNDIQDKLAGKLNVLTISTRPMFVVAFIIYFVITLVLIALVLAKMTKVKGKNLFYLIGIIVLSGPLYYVFYRGNVILTTFLLILVFFWLHQSEKRWQREVALVCLALAIAMKIYPVILVLVLFKERRWLDIVKTGVYAAAFVFVPFVFVAGNLIDNIKYIFNSYNSLINIGGLFVFAVTSFNGAATAIAQLLSENLGINVSNVLNVIANILKFTLVIVAVVTLFLCHKTERKFEVATVAIGCYILFQSVSYAYVFVFAFLLFALFLNSLETYSKRDLIFYVVLFAIIFFTVPFLFRNCLLQFFALVALVVKAIVDLWVEYAKSRTIKVDATQTAAADTVNAQ